MREQQLSGPDPSDTGGNLSFDVTPDDDDDKTLYYETEYKGDYTVVCERCFSAFPHTDHRMNIAEKTTQTNSEAGVKRRACVVCGCDTAHDQLPAHLSLLMDSPDDIFLDRDNEDTYEQFETFISGLYGTEIVPTVHYDTTPDGQNEIFERIRVTTLTSPDRSKEISQNIAHVITQMGLNSRVLNRLGGSGTSQMIIIGNL